MSNNWMFLSEPSVDTDWSGAKRFVTKGDPNDAQLEITVASHCVLLCNSVFPTQMARGTSMGTSAS